MWIRTGNVDSYSATLPDEEPLRDSVPTVGLEAGLQAMARSDKTFIFHHLKQSPQILEHPLLRIALGQIGENLRGNRSLPMVAVGPRANQIVPDFVGQSTGLSVALISACLKWMILPALMGRAQVIQ